VAASGGAVHKDPSTRAEIYATGSSTEKRRRQTRCSCATTKRGPTQPPKRRRLAARDGEGRVDAGNPI